jgi:hypothetical protein
MDMNSIERLLSENITMICLDRLKRLSYTDNPNLVMKTYKDYVLLVYY